MSPAPTMTPDDSRRAVLVAADELFYARGVTGVAMSDVRDTAGVSMRRLYSLYPSKRDLVAGWLADRHDRWMAWFTTTVDRLVEAGDDPVLATFDAIGEWVGTPGYRGCAFINSLAETHELDEAHRQIIADHKLELLHHLAHLVSGGRTDDPAWLPAAIAVMIDGAIVQCTVFGNTEPLDAARSAAARLLEGAPS